MPSMNISLTPELINIVHRQVDSGRYNNSSEVVRDAIRQFEDNNQLLYQLKLLRLRERLGAGIEETARGDFADYDLASFIQELDDKAV